MSDTERLEAARAKVWSAWITLDEDMPEEHWDEIDAAMQAFRPLICLAYGHWPSPDQCGIPEHDFCVVCGVSTPRVADAVLGVPASPKEQAP